MKKQLVFISITAILAIYSNCYAQDYHVRIGTIGNSITQGVSLPDPPTQCYPAQLATLLEEVYGDTCFVMNFGLTSTTMLKKGDYPYWNTTQFRDLLNYAPEICLILLGTNDSKPQNWDVYGDEYLDDYLSMIDTIKARNPSTRFMLGYPPPAFEIVWGIRDSVISNCIIPTIDTVLSQTGAELIDYYHPLLDSVSLFPDFIHPNFQGSRAMADIILDRIIESDIIHKADTGLTFITSFKTGIANLVVGDSATLSWTSINADSVKLNGQIVPGNGSLKVSPPETTEYTILAMGERTNDSLKLTQQVYTPELSRMVINPARVSLFEGDTINLAVKYYDQLGIMITDTTYDVQWSIASGSGSLIDKTDISVKYIAGAAGATVLLVEFGDLSATADITVKPLVAILNNPSLKTGVEVFPNPSDDILNLDFEIAEASDVSVKIYDMKGGLYHQEFFMSTTNGRQTHSLKTSHLPEGNYIIKMEFDRGLYTNMFVIKRN